MGRPAKVSDEQSIAVIEKYVHFFEDNNFPESGNDIWKKISAELNNNWKPHTVYTHIRDNKKNHLQIARRNLGLEELPISSKKNLRSLDDTNESHAMSTNNTLCCDRSYKFDDNSLCLISEYENSIQEEFDLTLSANEWEQIKPADDASLSQQRRLRPRVWMNVIANAIWSRYALKCGLVADYSYINPQQSDDNEFCLIFKAHCLSNKCGNKIIGCGNEKPVNGVLKIRFKSNDTRHVFHEEVKRPLNSLERKKVGQQLLKRRPAAYQDELTNKYMKFGESVPPFLQDKHIYRQVKCEAVKADLGLPPRVRTDVISAIKSLSTNQLYPNAIRCFDIMNCYVSFCTKEQIYVYKEYCRSVKESQICADAKGKILLEFQIMEGIKVGHVFFYSVTFNFQGQTVPVLQLLSDKHDEVSISHWLKECFTNLKMPPPKVAVSDQGRALMLAMCDTFNHLTIKEYVDACFLWAKGLRTTPWPANTQIRLDVAHFIKSITRWSSIKSLKHPGIRSFYIRLMALMIDCDTLEKFQYIFQLTCIVASHKNEDSKIKLSGKKEITVLHAQTCLANCLAERADIIDGLQEFANSEESEEIYEADEVDKKEELSSELTLTHQWIKCLIDECQPVNEEQNQLDCINKLFFKDFLPDLERKGKEFVLWTGAAIPNGRTHASTASQEGFFSQMESRIFEGIPLPCSLPRFIEGFLKYTKSSSSRASAQLTQYNHKKKLDNLPHLIHTNVLQTSTNLKTVDLRTNLKTTKYNFFNDSDFNSKENWKGLENDPRPFLQDDGDDDGDDDEKSIDDKKSIDDDEKSIEDDDDDDEEEKSSDDDGDDDYDYEKSIDKENRVPVYHKNNIINDSSSISKLSQQSFSFDTCNEVSDKSIKRSTFDFKISNLSYSSNTGHKIIDESTEKSERTLKTPVNSLDGIIDKIESTGELEHTFRTSVNSLDSIINKNDSNKSLLVNNQTKKSKEQIFLLKNSSTPKSVENIENDKKEKLNKPEKKKDIEPSHYFKPYPEARIIISEIGNGKYIKKKGRLLPNGKYKKKKGHLLPNGNVCKVFTINGIGISLENTCPHDVVIQILHFGALDYPHYFDFVKESKNESLKFTRQLIEKGVTQGLLLNRVVILNDHYNLEKADLSKKLHFLNAMDSIVGVYTKLFVDSNPTVESALKTYTCTTSGCSARPEIKLASLSLNVKTFQKYGFNSIEKSINYKQQICNIKCSQKNCTGAIKEKMVLGQQILIETDVRLHPSEPRPMYQLTDFPVDITLSKTYRLVGVIHYEKGHFVAYCRRATGRWIVCDSLQKKPVSCKKTDKISPDGIIYIQSNHSTD